MTAYDVTKPPQYTRWNDHFRDTETYRVCKIEVNLHIWVIGSINFINTIDISKWKEYGEMYRGI